MFYKGLYVLKLVLIKEMTKYKFYLTRGRSRYDWHTLLVLASMTTIVISHGAGNHGQNEDWHRGSVRETLDC